ncbi:MAG: PKD domain-containing protein, partial [Bacteroides sp.]|nr:PKD domain-containing protein [Bacteroides sp.]
MKTRIFSFMTMAFVAFLLVSCGEDTPAPVVEIFFEADMDDPYTINFTTTSSNASSFSWEFGDGNVAVGAEATHTYLQSGEYMVKVTATGDGGEAMATKDVSIAASISEILSGGPDAMNGKTWLVSRTSTSGVDGVGDVNPSYPNNMFPATDNLLDMIGLGAEYDNEFTFFHDGSYSINNVDGNNLAGWLFAATYIPEEDWVIPTAVGIFSVKSTPPADATWMLTEDTDLVVDAVIEDASDGSTTLNTVTFEDAVYITFGGGGFLALQDFGMYA